MNNFSFIPPAITAVSIVVFLLISIRKWNVPTYRALSLLCLNTIWWHGSWVVLFLTEQESHAIFLAKLGHVGILALPMTFHYFYATLVGKRTSLAVTKFSFYVLFLVCLIFTDWIIDGVNIFDWGYYPRAGILHPAFICVVSFFLISGLWLAFQAIRKTKDESTARVLRICQVGGVVYSLGGIDFLVNYRFIDNYPFGFSFSLLFIAIVSYAVFNSNLFTAEEQLKEAKRQNELLEEAIKERDYLRQNLEFEVKKKTKQLQENATQLASALVELRDTQATVIQNEKLVLLGTLTSGLAHELNNALNRVSGGIRTLEGYLDKIPENEDKTEISELFGVMKRGINLSIEIIANLKNYSVQERGSLTANNLYSIVKTVLAILKPKLNENIVITVKIPEDFCPVGSHAGMNQLISNLVTNGIDALPNGKGSITIEAVRSPDQWELYVSDTGHGIPEKYLNRIYDPFFTTKEQGKGTGIGLFIVRKEVERHNGKFSVKSAEGKGTTFHFEFPYLELQK